MPQSDQYPLPTFYFTVQIDGTDEQSSFWEVDGIAPGIETNDGQNKFAHILPKGNKITDLVLTRGAVAEDSPLFRWCATAIRSGVGSPIEPKTVNVYLLSQQGDHLVGWSFVNAYPLKCEIGDFNRVTHEAAIESITLRYAYFNRIDLGNGKKAD